jgi:hypothetical protein
VKLEGLAVKEKRASRARRKEEGREGRGRGRGKLTFRTNPAARAIAA